LPDAEPTIARTASNEPHFYGFLNIPPLSLPESRQSELDKSCMSMKINTIPNGTLIAIRWVPVMYRLLEIPDSQEQQTPGKSHRQ
jgi:hypothetical protein